MAFIVLAFQEKSLKNQEIIIGDQREIKSLLLNVLEKTATGDKSRDVMFQYLPLQDETSLESLDLELQSEEKFNSLVN